jgi:hypothetical protein
MYMTAPSGCQSGLGVPQLSTKFLQAAAIAARPRDLAVRQLGAGMTAFTYNPASKRMSLIPPESIL